MREFVLVVNASLSACPHAFVGNERCLQETFTRRAAFKLGCEIRVTKGRLTFDGRQSG